MYITMLKNQASKANYISDTIYYKFNYVCYNNMFYTLHYITDLFHICTIQWNIIKGWRIIINILTHKAIVQFTYSDIIQHVLAFEISKFILLRKT